jgi:integrase
MLGAPPSDRKQVLRNDEIRFVMATESPAGPLLRFLLLTGLRIGEAYNGHREGQLLGGARQRLEEPAGAPRVVGRAGCGPARAAPLSGAPIFVQHWVTANAGGWSCHDLRRTFSTRLNGMGVAPHVVERMLNHTLPGVMGVYNRSEYDAERRQALEAQSMWLLALVEKQAADVVSVRQVSQQAA